MANSQQAQLEATRELRHEVARQGELAKNTAETLEKMPGALDGVSDKLDQNAKAGVALKDSVETVNKSVRSLADGSQRAQNTLLAEFRRAQDEHRHRLEDLVDRERRVFYVVGVLGLLVVASLVVLIVRGGV